MRYSVTVSFLTGDINTIGLSIPQLEDVTRANFQDYLREIADEEVDLPSVACTVREWSPNQEAQHSDP